jgi:YHS domain-containing protein
MSTITKLFKAAALAALVAMSACAPLVTQNPGAGYSPANVKNIDGAERLLLDGHDVVSYFTENTHRKGKPEINSTFKGVRVNFSSAEHKTKFDQNPEAYLPQFGGFCANGIVYGIPWGGDADSWRIVDGKLYIFGGIGSKKGFELDVPGNIALANKYWKEEINGSNALFQRSKRMVMRVPHYKSGEDLAKLIAQKEGAPK